MHPSLGGRAPRTTPRRRSEGADNHRRRRGDAGPEAPEASPVLGPVCGILRAYASVLEHTVPAVVRHGDRAVGGRV